MLPLLFYNKEMEEIDIFPKLKYFALLFGNFYYA